MHMHCSVFSDIVKYTRDKNTLNSNIYHK